MILAIAISRETGESNKIPTREGKYNWDSREGAEQMLQTALTSDQYGVVVEVNNPFFLHLGQVLTFVGTTKADEQNWRSVVQ
jgi:hypothetical protein